MKRSGKRTFSAITAEIVRVDGRLSELYEEYKQAVRRTLIRCQSCKRSSQCSEWIFIQWYMNNRSRDNDAEYYNKMYCDIVCPLCKVENGIHRHKQEEVILAFFRHGNSPKDIFKSVETKKKV